MIDSVPIFMAAPALTYRTNAADFDFVVHEGRPKLTYVIASTPRSGSNLLQRALWRTGRAGAPEAYLAEAYVEDYATRWPDILNACGEMQHEVDLFRYRLELFRHRTTPNGVFGIKLYGSHLDSLMTGGVLLEDLFSNAKYLWMRRRDRLAQAVSYALAEQTGIWILDGEWLRDKLPLRQPHYDYQAILHCLRRISNEESQWSKYIEMEGVSPMTVWYEDLVAEYETVVGECLRFIGVEEDEGEIPEPGIRRQSTRRNEEWAERFFNECLQSSRLDELRQLLRFEE